MAKNSNEDVWVCPDCGWSIKGANIKPWEGKVHHNCKAKSKKKPLPRSYVALVRKHCEEAQCENFRSDGQCIKRRGCDEASLCPEGKWKWDKSMEAEQAEDDPWKRFWNVLNKGGNLLQGKGRSEDGRASLDRTLICVTTFKRQESLNRLLNSIAKFYPKVCCKAEDTKGNLSAGRNRLVKAAKEMDHHFVLIMEDDFELMEDSRLEALCDVLNFDSEVGVVCGALISNGRLETFGKDLHRFRGFLEATMPPACPWMMSENGTRYRYVDMASNFFLARREVLEELPWDEDLELLEHGPWFWSLKQQGRWRVAVTDATKAHHYRDRPTEEYRKLRHRFQGLPQITEKRYGFRRVVVRDLAREQGIISCRTFEGRPNLVIFGAGHQGSRLFVQMAKALGWRLENLKPNVMENRTLQKLNKVILRERGICECGQVAERKGLHQYQCLRCRRRFSPKDDLRVEPPIRFLESLEEPWVLKDPRLVVTIGDKRWREAFDKTRPVLVLIEMGLEKVRRKYEKNKWPNGIFGHSIEELRQIAREEYERWPWGKIEIHYEDLIRAARCVDWKRVV